MSSTFRAFLHSLFRSKPSAGKITLATALTVAVVSVMSFGAYFDLHIPQANAANVQTSVTVLNTPPVWDSPAGDAHESVESSTSTPTNAGTVLSFKGTATDSNNDNYFLLICKTSATPAAVNNGPPTCGGGISNRWAVSATTTSGSEAIASTSTIANLPFNVESNAWFGWVCDANPSGAQCNATFKQGNNDPTLVSPFVINHPPIFFSIINSGPVNPGGTESWTATATDTDLIRGGDMVKLIICKVFDYATSTGACGAGGTWALSTLVHFNPSTSTTLVIPTQDKTYNAFVFITDQNNLDATSSVQGTNSSFVVNNIAPTVSPATISVGTTTGDIILTRPHATSGPFQVKFTVSDNNSCQNTSSGNEIASATTTIFRSGIGASACQSAGQFDTNNCYPSVQPQTVITCTQDAGSCTPGTTNANWTCTFSLWYNADATDPTSKFPSENWLAMVQVTDDNGALSTATTSSTGNDVDQFLAVNVSTTSIAYGGLQPGGSVPLVQSTDLQAYGNVGLDESLYGDTMCTNWAFADSCDAGGPDPTKKIPVGNQQASTTASAAYNATGNVTLTASTSPASVAIHVPKTTATSSPQNKNTFWGIAIPGSITTSGAYTGQDTITAVTSNTAFW